MIDKKLLIATPLAVSIGFFAAPVVGMPLSMTLGSLAVCGLVGGGVCWLVLSMLNASDPPPFVFAIMGATLGAAIFSLPMMPVVSAACLGAGIDCVLEALLVGASSTIQPCFR